MVFGHFDWISDSSWIKFGSRLLFDHWSDEPVFQLKNTRAHTMHIAVSWISVFESSFQCDAMWCDELNVVQWNCIASQRIDNLGLDLCTTWNYNLNKTNNLIQIMLAWRSIHFSILKDAPMSINICIHKYLQCFRRKLYTPFGISSTWIHIKHI